MDETLALDEAIAQAKMTVLSLVEASRKLRAERAAREAYIAELETRIGQVTPERIATLDSIRADADAERALIQAELDGTTPTP